MARDVGEDLAGAWLRLIAECDFVQYNVPLRGKQGSIDVINANSPERNEQIGVSRGKQGEIDVIGINLEKNKAYICEVATHLGGLFYANPKTGLPDNVEKITRKFRDDVDYARQYLSNFEHYFMLWSPIVKRPRSDSAKHSQSRDLIEIQAKLQNSHQANIEMIVNEVYLQRVNELRKKAEKETAASEYPVFRLLQILSQLEKHVKNLPKNDLTNGKNDK